MLEAIVEQFEPNSFARHDYFVAVGKVNTHHFFMTEGFMRAFTYNPEGEEETTDFFNSNRPVFEANSFITQVKSMENIQAITDCQGFLLPFEKSNALFHTVPEFREFGRRMLQIILAFLEFSTYFRPMHRTNLPLAAALLRRGHLRAFIFFIFVLCACHSSDGKADNGGKPAGDGKPASPKVEAIGTDSLAILLKQWKEDSLGCQHVRTIGSFERLLKGYSLAQKNEAEILQVLGPPNAEERYPGKSIAIYYFESVCAANKIIKGSDKSSILLTFDEQKRYQRYDPSIE